MDTVRPDHLSTYGYERPTSPFLDEIAASSIVFSRAYSTSSWTFPSHASLFTGLYPAAHSAHSEHMLLDSHHATLPEVLQKAGYRTVGVSENPLITKSRGFGQGFDELRDPEDESATLDALREIEQVLESHDPARPLFLFINIMAAHAPYDSSREFFASFLSDPSYIDKVDWQFDPVLPLSDATLPTKLKLHMVEHYDAELRYVDHTIRQVAQTLKERQLWESTLLIVTSDHGEALGEKDYVLHQYSLYEPVLRVPLLLHYPRLLQPAKNESLVQLTDVFPTLLSIIGLDNDRYPTQGRNLLSTHGEAHRPVIAEYYLHPRFQLAPERLTRAWQAFNRRLRAIRVGNWKLIQATNGHTELYNLGTDPGEMQNLHGKPESLATERALLRLLEEALATPPGERPSSSSPRDQTQTELPTEVLESLGYL